MADNEDTCNVADNRRVWTRRLTKQEYDRVVTTRADGLLQTLDADNNPSGAHVLRPKKTEEPSLSESYLEEGTQNNGEMRMVNKAKYTDMWNEAILEHSEQSKECRVPQFEIDRELKKGICWKQGLRCFKCDFRSKLYKLYDEIPRTGPGAKTAAPNAGLQVGLMESMCGNSKARVIFSATNTPPPTKSSMNEMSVKVGAITATMVSDDLKMRREQCKEINTMRGLSEQSPVNIGIDVRYNSNTITGRHKMGQNASQAIGIAIEHQTDEQQIVALDVRNQLCSKGKRLKMSGGDVTCPGGHPGCSANTMENEPLSEYTIGEEIGNMFARQGVPVRHVTTDGDGRSAEGVAVAMKNVYPESEVIRQADTTHLGQTQFRHVTRGKWTKNMFPGATADIRKKQLKNFGLDLKSRCHAVYNDLYRHFDGDLKKIGARLPETVEAILDCYAGNCTNCKQKFTACNGGKVNSWWAKSINLRPSGIEKLNITANDRKQLKSTIEIKLSEESIELLKLNKNTNKNEAVNRGISASLPKNVNFSRNALGRASAAVDRLNYGTGDSILRKLEAVGSPISKGGYVARAVRGFQNECKYNRAYRKQTDVRTRNMMHRAQAIREHYRAHRARLAGKKNKVQRKLLYRKGQLDPKPIIRRVPKSKRSPSKPPTPQIHIEKINITQDHGYFKLNTCNSDLQANLNNDIDANTLPDSDCWDHDYCLYV